MEVQAPKDALKANNNIRDEHEINLQKALDGLIDRRGHRTFIAGHVCSKTVVPDCEKGWGGGLGMYIGI